MSDPNQLVTVFRSADESAADDAATVLDALADGGLNPALLTDEFPGVPPGAVEVRVPPGEEAQAETILARLWSQPAEPADNSHALDLVDIYQGAGTTGEVEALSIRAVLDAYQIPNVVVGTSQMPNLPFQVKVPMSYREQAEGALAEAASAPVSEEE